MSTFWKPTTQTTSWKPSTQPELYHHGVKGMKWGKHLKSAGEAAYGVAGGAAEEEYEKALADLEDPNALERNGEDKWDRVIEAEKKWLTSPLGRIKNAKRRFSELKYDIILDDAPVRNKIKRGASWMADYLKNG